MPNLGNASGGNLFNPVADRRDGDTIRGILGDGFRSKGISVAGQLG